jgi:hypothetical protein
MNNENFVAKYHDYCMNNYISYKMFMVSMKYMIYSYFIRKHDYFLKDILIKSISIA